jgi:hypothetical protein
MSTKLFGIALTVIMLFNNICQLIAQGGEIEQITIFGSRIKSPVTVDVDQDQGKINFKVINRSYYPYDFTIKFGQFQNLTPRIFERRTTVFPGITRLFTLIVQDPNEPPQMSYEISYKMTNTTVKIDLRIPYLVPVGEGKTVTLFSFNGEPKFIENCFAMNPGDTVFAGRKGQVTALPDKKAEVERVSNEASMEVRHDDGTIAVYVGLDPETNFLKLGQTIYPGQPVGVINNSGQLKMNVLLLQGDGRLKNLDIYFADQNGQLISSNKIPGTKVAYPETVIKLEMSKKEIKKYDNKNLYN